MKTKIKNWLGITTLEKIIGREKEPESMLSRLLLNWVWDRPKTILSRLEILEEENRLLKEFLKVEKVTIAENVVMRPIKKKRN